MAKRQSRENKVVYFNDERSWFHCIKEEDHHLLILGISQEALDELEEVQSIALPELGDDVDKDDLLFKIRGSNGEVEFPSPAAGFVRAVNEAVVSDPQILQEDPIDEGWLVQLEIQDKSDLAEYES